MSSTPQGRTEQSVGAKNEGYKWTGCVYRTPRSCTRSPGWRGKGEGLGRCWPRALEASKSEAPCRGRDGYRLGGSGRTAGWDRASGRGGESTREDLRQGRRKRQAAQQHQAVSCSLFSAETAHSLILIYTAR